MTARRLLGSLAVLAVAALLIWQLPAFTQDKDKKASTGTAWKAFNYDKDAKEQKSVYQTLYTKTTQVMTVNNMDVKQEQEQTFYIKWTPEKNDKKDSKDWIVEQEIIGVKMSIDIGGNKISFDSTEANPPQNPMTDFFKALTQVKLKYTINSEADEKQGGFKVVSIDKVDEFRKKLTATNPAMDTLLKNILNEDALKQMAEPTWAAYPPKGNFAAMTKWERPSNLDLGPIGTYKFENKYTVTEANKKIEIDSTLTYAKPDAKKAEGLPFKIVEGSLSTKKDKPGKGHALWDGEKGRFSEVTMDLALTGSLKIDISGTDTTVALDQTQTSKITTSDTDPRPGKK